MPHYFWTDDRGWNFCEQCNGSRDHRIGWDIHLQSEVNPVKQCCGCGLITERKPRQVPLDKYDRRSS